MPTHLNNSLLFFIYLCVAMVVGVLYAHIHWLITTLIILITIYIYIAIKIIMTAVTNTYVVLYLSIGLVVLFPI